MICSSIGPIAVAFPDRQENIDDLAKEFPNWDMQIIREKTGVRLRHISGPEECASDIAVRAAEKLFETYHIDRQSIDFLLFCTQSPDYILPTTACVLQSRLCLPTTVGAFDFNLGCSGFVYGLGIADGFIRAGAKRVLLLTAETYTKYIHPSDRSLRTIFGDGAAATLIEATEMPSLHAFDYCTDGSGADLLIVTDGGARKTDRIVPRKRQRWPSDLSLAGPGLVKFTLARVPKSVASLLERSGWTADELSYYLLHQATAFMLENVRAYMRLPEEKMPQYLSECGNTVSSTIPILIHHLRETGQLRPGMKNIMIGFGVGLSSAGAAWTERFDPADYLAPGGL
ncbi:MAG: ketoacyl-ACP synthase III [Thermoguttaceae bacterium]|nr:ketoacyl-ACP synthase III [Thermoguttaceae bacterium]